MSQGEDKGTLRKGGVGRGIASLLGSEPNLSEQTTQSAGGEPQQGMVTLLSLPVDAIVPNPKQPRKYFDENELQELTQSVLKEGVIQPIIVTKLEQPGRYMLVAGERRWRAAKQAALLMIPAILSETSDRDLLKLALIENIQRRDLNMMEEAEAYQMLLQDESLTHEQCADLVGKDRATVSNIIRLLSLPREIQDDVSNGRMTMGHGKAILGLDSPRLMLRCREMVLKRGLNVRQTEQLVNSLKNSQKGIDPQATSKDADLDYLVEMLRAYFQTKIKISGKSSKGKIEINYFSSAELERILKLMGQPLG